MIKVNFTPPVDDDWKDWIDRCEKATVEMMKKFKAGEEYSINDKLYKEKRAVYYEVFSGKCAYCERKFILDQSGDVDHFRPKGGVTDGKDKPIQISDGNGGFKNHPGYVWLVYHWKNLLPSCSFCNRPSTHEQVGRVGKWNRFPVKKKHATCPEEISNEEPLLLNPLIDEDDPSKHLDFDPETGRIIPKTERGEACVDIFYLNRDGLPEARRDIYDAVRARAKDALNAEFDGDHKKLERHLDFLLQHKLGVAELAMAGRPAFAMYLAALERQAKRLT